jgi:hypothetical protein
MHTEEQMTTAQELSVRDKKELVSKEEQTAAGRHYVPYTDIYEIDDVLSVVMEVSRAAESTTRSTRLRKGGSYSNQDNRHWCGTASPARFGVSCLPMSPHRHRWGGERA